jgi:hypothetical protein
MSERDANADHTERHALAGRGLSTHGQPVAALRTRWLPNAVRNPARSFVFSSADPCAAVGTPVGSGSEDAAWNARLSDVVADFDDDAGELYSLENPGVQTLGFETSPRARSLASAASLEDAHDLREVQPLRSADSASSTMRALPKAMDTGSFTSHGAHAASNAAGDRMPASDAGNPSDERHSATESRGAANLEMDTRERRLRPTTNAWSESGDRVRGTSGDLETNSVEEVRGSGRMTSDGEVTLREGNADHAAQASDSSVETRPSASVVSSDLRRKDAANASLEPTWQAERPGLNTDGLRPRASSRHESSVDRESAAHGCAGSSRVAEMGMPDAATAGSAMADTPRSASTSAVQPGASSHGTLEGRASMRALPDRSSPRRPAPLDAASIAALLAPSAASSGPSVTIDRVQVTVQAPSPKSVPQPSPMSTTASPAASAARSGAAHSGYRSPWASYFTRHD